MTDAPFRISISTSETANQRHELCWILCNWRSAPARNVKAHKHDNDHNSGADQGEFVPAVEAARRRGKPFGYRFTRVRRYGG